MLKKQNVVERTACFFHVFFCPFPFSPRLLPNVERGGDGEDDEQSTSRVLDQPLRDVLTEDVTHEHRDARRHAVTSHRTGDDAGG